MTTPTRWYPDPAYRDDVHPGDPTSVRELAGLTVRKITVSATWTASRASWPRAAGGSTWW